MDSTSKLSETFSAEENLNSTEQQLCLQRDSLLLNEAMIELQTLLRPETFIHPVPKEHLLFRACQLVGKELGLQFRASHSLTENQEENLQHLCLHSHIFYRRIRLLDHEWDKPSIPFVAFYGEEKEPVALLPHHSGGYQLIKPLDGTTSIVNQAIIACLSPVGYLFYRQLPESPLTFRQAWHFIFAKRRGEWNALLLLILSGTLVSMSLPIITRFLFDEIIPNRDMNFLFQITIGMLVISLSMLAFNFGQEVLLLRLRSLTDHELQMAIWQRLIRLPMHFFRNRPLDDLLSLTTAMKTIRTVLTHHAIQVVISASFALIDLFLLFYYSVTLGTVGCLFLFIQGLAIVIPLRCCIRQERQLLDQRMKVEQMMTDILHAFTKIRLAGAEIRLFFRWEQAYAKMKHTSIASLFFRLKSTLFQLFWSHASIWGLSLFVILNVVNQEGDTPLGSLTLGSLMAFLCVFTLLNQALMQLGGTILNAIEVIPLWEKITSFTKGELEETTIQTDQTPLEGEIRIDHVTFSYQAETPPVIKNLSCLIRPGESVAFVGPSGCGKTTLLRLILGFECPDQGSIYFDNKDIRGLNLQVVRRQLGVVLQSGAIFDGTIFDNINSGRHYSSTEVEEALRSIGAGPFIEECSMGIHTVLKNGGSVLSEGQRQWILLARAMVGKPKILILDEPTRALDQQKQHLIHEFLQNLPMTRMIISQRFNLVRRVDYIYVMEKGQIVDEGTFSELTERRGPFVDGWTQPSTRDWHEREKK